MTPFRTIAMPHSFEGTTLALQHYYDITAVSRKLPLLTVYQASEQPFGQKMAVWMAEYGDRFGLDPETVHRLDDALMHNRAVRDPHALRVLDYGSGEGSSFVVTDAMAGVSLRARLLSSGPLPIWQVLRLLDQLTGIVNAAHASGFHDLCITSDNIFIVDDAHFEIVTGPLGIGLHRGEILRIKDVSISPDLMRHIPPWEFERPQSPMLSTASLSAALHADDVAESADAGAANDGNEIQDIDSSLATLEAPNDLCSDVYSLAAIAYEALCAQHPFFHDGQDLCDAALTMFQSAPPRLSRRVEIPEELSNLVMDTIRTPKAGTENDFLAGFSSLCSKEDREAALQSAKAWVAPPSHLAKRPLRKAPTAFRHPFAIAAVAALVLVVVAVLVTWRLSSTRAPVDLFALPEILPAATHGVDVVLTSRATPPNTDVYITSLADGKLIRLGTMPFIYRSQESGARLNFVLADDKGNTMQIPVTVHGDQGLMVVPVDFTW